MVLKLRNDKRARWVFTFCCVVLSGFLQAAIIQIFMEPINLLSSGFTGVAILISKITSTFFGFSFLYIIRNVSTKYPSSLVLQQDHQQTFHGIFYASSILC